MAHARCPRCRFVSDFKVDEEQKDRRRGNFKEDEDGYLQVDLCRVCGHGGIERSVDQGGYFNRELEAVKDEWPRMGVLCPHCNLRIPRFLDLDAATAAKARKLVAGHSMVAAIKLVRESTGCGLNWARLWAEHPEGPREPEPWPGPPCVYCGEPLRTAKAKQCLECGMDWHDPDNIHRLG